MRDQGRVLNHGHRSRVSRRGGGVWWVLQQEEGLSNNRPRGTWKGVDQYFSCYLLTIIWPAAPNKPRKTCKLVLFLVSVLIYFTQSKLQIAYIWHQLTHLCFRLRASYISCQDTSWALRASCFHANYHSYFTHLAVTFKSMLCANVAPPDHPDLPVSDDFYKI